MGFLALWLPILLTGIVLFFASFVAWTVLKHHESDFSKLPDEDQFMSTVRGMNLPAGSYMFPYMTHEQNKDPAMIERYTAGPRGKLVVWDTPNMGRNLAMTFVYFLVVAAITAYIAKAALPTEGVGFGKAFQVTSAIGILVYGSSGLLNAVWFPRRILMDVLDGIAYGVIMGLIFALLWR
jgi:hypothetical protein